MLHVINALHLIDMESETHYSLRNEIPIGEYPQVHDFYEFTFVTSGRFRMTVGTKSYTATEGDLFIIRPGVVHGKYNIPGEASSHINLAFFASTMESLLSYLFSGEEETFLPNDQILFKLEPTAKNFIQSEMEYLALFPTTAKKEERMYLRHLLSDIIYRLSIPGVERQTITPAWFNQVLLDLKNQNALVGGLPSIVEKTGLSEAHVCRTFKRYVGMSPTKYINMLRLNYAANMLAHSDRPIETISEDIGFSSLSYFYNQFKNQYKTSPSAYRKQNANDCTKPI